MNYYYYSKKRTAKPNHWTRSAIECHARHFNCKGCFYDTFFEPPYKCNMKYAVAQLVLLYGLPADIDKYFNEEESEYDEKQFE